MDPLRCLLGFAGLLRDNDSVVVVRTFSGNDFGIASRRGQIAWRTEHSFRPYGRCTGIGAVCSVSGIADGMVTAAIAPPRPGLTGSCLAPANALWSGLGENFLFAEMASSARIANMIWS